MPWGGETANCIRRSKASVGGLCYPSLTAAFLARRRIDFAAGRRRLSYRGKSGAVAGRTFKFSRLRRWLFHSNLPEEKGTTCKLPH